MALIFWDADGIMVDYLKKGQLISRIYYASLLEAVKRVIALFDLDSLHFVYGFIK